MDGGSWRAPEGSRCVGEGNLLRNAAGQVVQSSSPSSDRGHDKRKIVADDDGETRKHGDVADGDDRFPKRSKVSFGLMSKTAPSSSSSSSIASAAVHNRVLKATGTPPISMKLGTQKLKEPAASLVRKASVFGNAADDDDDEEEEMPPEAKMRMRNVGRETPTSTGPNSFGKTSKGFCDTRMIFEKNLKGTSRGQSRGGNE